MSSFFFAKLVPNRPDFPANLTQEEGATMQQHGMFLMQQLAAGALVVAGPVLDPNGVFGMGVFEAESIDAVRALLATDPANAIGRYEVVPIGRAVARPKP